MRRILYQAPAPRQPTVPPPPNVTDPLHLHRPTPTLPTWLLHDPRNPALVPTIPHGTAHGRVRPRIDRKKRRSPRAGHRDMRDTNKPDRLFNKPFFLADSATSFRNGLVAARGKATTAAPVHRSSLARSSLVAIQCLR